MIMNDQDPDVVRWGLHLLQGGFSGTAYCGTTTQRDANRYEADYSSESNVIIDSTSVENDEVIAHVLQEELSQVALAEASGKSPAGEEHLQASVLTQDWLSSPVNNLISVVENEDGLEAFNNMEHSSSCSSMGDKICEGERCSLELTDDFSCLDGEVGKRLNSMVPIPHVPRINGEIPSVDEATSDHERLLERLKLYDLVEQKVQGDGNCQFRALSDQFYRTIEHHNFVRQQIVNQLMSHPEMYEGYVPMGYGEYLEKMSKYDLFLVYNSFVVYYEGIFSFHFSSPSTWTKSRSGEWGDHVTLQAAADSYGVKIFVLTSFKDTCYIEIMPSDEKSKRVVFLSFWAEVHYNSIYPEGELPAPETKRKKRWWHFGYKH